MAVLLRFSMACKWRKESWRRNEQFNEWVYTCVINRISQRCQILVLRNNTPQWATRPSQRSSTRLHPSTKWRTGPPKPASGSKGMFYYDGRVWCNQISPFQPHLSHPHPQISSPSPKAKLETFVELFFASCRIMGLARFPVRCPFTFPSVRGGFPPCE